MAKKFFPAGIAFRKSTGAAATSTQKLNPSNPSTIQPAPFLIKLELPRARNSKWARSFSRASLSPPIGRSTKRSPFKLETSSTNPSSKAISPACKTNQLKFLAIFPSTTKTLATGSAPTPPKAPSTSSSTSNNFGLRRLDAAFTASALYFSHLMSSVIQIQLDEPSLSPEQKESQLLSNLAKLPSLIVALSGGADSAYL